MSYIPLSDIIDEFNFSSAQHFNSFCKQYLGDTQVICEKKTTLLRNETSMVIFC